MDSENHTFSHGHYALSAWYIMRYTVYTGLVSFFLYNPYIHAPFLIYIIYLSIYKLQPCATSLIHQAFSLNAVLFITQVNENFYKFYCMKPPNIKAPKCTLYSIQCFIFQGQRSQGLNGLATAHCEHRWGQLTSESPFRIIESG